MTILGCLKHSARKPALLDGLVSKTLFLNDPISKRTLRKHTNTQKDNEIAELRDALCVSHDETF